MPRVLVVEVESTGPGVAAYADRARDTTEPLELSRQAWIALGRGEFRQAAWRPPSGSLRPWAPVRQAFGGGRRPLGGESGSLFQSYDGGGGGFVRRSPGSIEFGSSLVYAGIHRGGTGEVRAADAGRPHRQKLTRKQRAFLAIRFREENPGASFGRPEGDPDRGFLVTPRRPHFTQSPELRTRVSAIFSAWVAGRDVPQRLVEAG